MENPEKYNNGVCPNKVIIDCFILIEYMSWLTMPFTINHT